MIMLTINIPFKTPTINHLYGFRGYHKFMTKEGRELRKRIIERTREPIKHTDMTQYEGRQLTVTVVIHENWFTKKGDIARKDVANREKFLIDSVFMALELDDKQIFLHRMRKCQDEDEYAAVMIDVL